MASTSNVHVGNEEGVSDMKVPFFNGHDFPYWKNRMEIYLKSRDYRIWLSVKNGPFVPHTKVDNNIIVKLEQDWNDDDMRKVTIDNKALNSLLVALDKAEYNLVRRCESAHDVWNLLIITHEGTDQVRNAKMAILNKDYEMFVMLPTESIKDMNNRFNDIVNGLLSLGKVFAKDELVRKILGCLPEEWEPKVTAIEEAKDLSILSMEELLGSLMTHEVKLQKMKEAKGVEKAEKKKEIALKSKAESDDDDEEELDEEVILLARRFKQFSKWNKARRNFKKEGEGPTCFECKKPGHIKVDCPRLKKKKFEKFDKKKKAFNAMSYVSEDDSSDEEEETANLCLMAHESEDEEVDSYSFQELQDTYDDLLVEYENLCRKFTAYKKKLVDVEEKNKALELDNSKLKEHNQSMEKQLLKSKEQSTLDVDLKKESLLVENNLLKEKNAKLEKSFSKFTLGSQSLDKIVGVQKSFFEKAGIGFEPPTKEEVKTHPPKVHTHPPKPKRICHICQKPGHLANTCYKRKIVSKRTKTKQIWVVKGTYKIVGNFQGPNKIWVPKKCVERSFVGGKLLEGFK